MNRITLAPSFTALLLVLTTFLALNAAISPARSAATFGRQSEYLSLSEARLYLLSLINRDRALYRLPSVSLDEIATIAAQKHTDEMSVHGYMSHWDLNGTKPQARYTAAGGQDAVYENVSGWCDGCHHKLAPVQNFTRKELETIQSEFINEVPPHDGHRQNILDFSHNKVGIGLTLVVEDGHRRVQCAQEFVDRKGTYSEVPRRLTRDVGFSVAGRLNHDVTFEHIEIRWEPYPKPLSITTLNNHLPYEDPVTSVARYAPGSDKPVSVKRSDNGDEFVATVTPQADWKKGLYYIQVWARTKADKVKFVVSSRTALLG